MGYPAMKGQLEDDLIGMNYEHTVILRPGLLMGPRYVLTSFIPLTSSYPWSSIPVFFSACPCLPITPYPELTIPSFSSSWKSSD